MNETVRTLRCLIENAEPFRGVVENGHIQTLLGHFLPSANLSAPGFDSSLEQVELLLPDGDRLIGFRGRPRNNLRDQGYLHIFHGLAGSTQSSYMRRTAHMARELGLNAVMWNHRGCGPGRKLALQPYHSGRSDDLSRVVKWGRDQEIQEGRTTDGRHGVVGFSLSGNATVLLAAGVVPTLGQKPLSANVFENTLKGSLPDFAIAVSPPFDLAKAARRLSSGGTRIYGQSFLPALIESLDDRSAADEFAAKARKKLRLYDSIGTFDAHYTGVASGFHDHFDYYKRASSGPYLNLAQRPLVVLTADDDPITHGSKDLAFSGEEKDPSEIANPFLIKDFQKCGGHMGFIDQVGLTAKLSDEPRWLEKRIRLYLKTFLDEDLSQ